MSEGAPRSGAGRSALARLLAVAALGLLVERLIPGPRARAAGSPARVAKRADSPPQHGAARRSAEHEGGRGEGGDRAPGDEHPNDQDVARGVRGYLVGLALAALLTVASFWIAAGGGLVWGPGVPVLLVVLAIAQMGVHLVFFLHITTGSENVNNVLALAFGTLIVILVIGGTLWIMANLDHAMMPMEDVIRMQR